MFSAWPHPWLYLEALIPTAIQEGSVLASSTATPEAAPGATSKLKFPRRGKKRSIWAVNRIEGMKLILNKKRRASYRPEDLEAFYRLLGGSSELRIRCLGPTLKTEH